MSELEASKSLAEHLEGCRELLKILGLMDEEGNLLREVATHADTFDAELDDRLAYEPSYERLRNLVLYFLVRDGNSERESDIYAFHGESNDIIYAISHFFAKRKFGSAVECFAGAGHAGIKARAAGILMDGAHINALEMNAAAIALAQANSAINEAGVSYHQGNIINDGFNNMPASQTPGNTIYFGNPPFGIPAPGENLELCRDGGSNGLKQLIPFIEGALNHGTTGDAIVGVAYSRINTAGEYEVEQRLKALQSEGYAFTYKIELVPGAKLWRGYNGRKEQSNPMNLDNMKAKANPATEQEKYQKYEEQAKAYKAEGWTQLGYIRYAIEITGESPHTTCEETHKKITETL